MVNWVISCSQRTSSKSLILCKGAPMIVNVAGAGAGKTKNMADIVLSHDIPDGKIAFCIAFTNAAAENIKEKVVAKLGCVPKNIKISTIHSFLYQELIEPYFYFLYGKQYRSISTISLPADNGFKATKVDELESADILHVTTQIVYRTNDNKAQRSGELNQYDFS